MGSSYQKTAKDTLTYGIATVLTYLVPMVQLPLLTKTLGATDYGLWALARTTVSLVLPFCGLGLTVAMIRFLAAEKDRSEVREGFYSVVLMQFLASFVVASVIFVFAEHLAVSFFDGAVLVVRITAAIIIVSMLEPLYLNLLRAFRQVTRYSIFYLADRYVFLGVIAYLLLNGYGLLSVLLAYLAVRFLIILILFAMVWSQVGIKMPDFSKIKEYLKFGLPTVPASMGFWLVNLSDRYVIGCFLGAKSVGIYSAAYAIGHFPYGISAVIGFILLPALSKLYDEGRMDEMKTHLSYSVKYLLTIVIPFIFGAVVLAEPVLRLFSTSEIAAQGWFVLPLVALSCLFLGAQGIVSNILFLTKKTRILAVTWIVSAALNLGLNILVVPHLGIIGAAITTLIAYSLAFGIVGYYAFREISFDANWRFIVKSLVASAVMSVVVWVMAPQGNVLTVLAIVVGVVVYGVVLVMLKGFTMTEFRFFMRLLKIKRN